MIGFRIFRISPSKPSEQRGQESPVTAACSSQRGQCSRVSAETRPSDPSLVTTKNFSIRTGADRESTFRQAKILSRQTPIFRRFGMLAPPLHVSRLAHIEHRIGHRSVHILKQFDDCLADACFV